MTLTEGNKIIADWMNKIIESVGGMKGMLAIKYNSQTPFESDWNLLMLVYCEIKASEIEDYDIIQFKSMVKAALMEGNKKLLHSKIIEFIINDNKTQK